MGKLNSSTCTVSHKTAQCICKVMEIDLLTELVDRDEFQPGFEPVKLSVSMGLYVLCSNVRAPMARW